MVGGNKTGHVSSWVMFQLRLGLPVGGGKISKALRIMGERLKLIKTEATGASSGKYSVLEIL